MTTTKTTTTTTKAAETRSSPVGSAFTPWKLGDASDTYLVVFFMGIDSEAGNTAHCRRVARFTQCRYVHCELYFPKDGLSFTTDVNAGIVYSTNRIRGIRHGWSMRSIRVMPQQYENALRHCRSMDGAPFAYGAYYLYFLGPGIFYDAKSENLRPNQRRYICARVVCEALQEASVINRDVDSRQVHTGHVYNEVLLRSSVVVPVAATTAAAAASRKVSGVKAAVPKSVSLPSVASAERPPPRPTPTPSTASAATMATTTTARSLRRSQSTVGGRGGGNRAFAARVARQNVSVAVRHASVPSADAGDTEDNIMGRNDTLVHAASAAFGAIYAMAVPKSGNVSDLLSFTTIHNGTSDDDDSDDDNDAGDAGGY